MSDQKRKDFMQKLSETKQFRELQTQFAKASAQHRANLKQRWDSNAEQQRKASLSSDARAREAVEQMVPRIKEFNDFKSGRDTSESAAREKAVELAEKADRQKK